ncbi:hypothetical protein [Paenisporosarcina antarctica]|uniref:Uncharacterized protein n=1 Tax=Paenisporosarcina antarctica TaxID=417367 RepID=A0A4P7A201_9BACL|nr:hypothetical protein [Paenisporosarcina antarctica]QBP42743.1 hypothetical protein E2636_17060 [Paenisporosarcina antarctica]
MIVRNLKKLYIAIGIFILVMILNFPFPHVKPFAEANFGIMNISISSSSGLHYLGIFSLVLLIIGIYFLATSLEKYRVRLVILALVVYSLLPLVIVESYQTTFASGIYAVKYEQDSSNCEFDRVDDKTMAGVCELTFRNYSNDDVHFDVTFYNKEDFESDSMISLMNEGSPYKVSLSGKETRTVHFNTEIDISNLNAYTNGIFSLVNIQIRQGKKVRYL